MHRILLYLKPKTRLGILALCAAISIGVFGMVTMSSAQTGFIGDLFTGLLNAIISAISYVLTVITTLIMSLTVWALKFFMEIAKYNGYVDTPTVVVGWFLVRDVANMFFVVVLLAIAFGTILGIEQYEWKKTLVNFILAALFINFSKLIAGLIIDAAHVFTMAFLNAIINTAGGNVISMLKLDKIMSIIGQNAGITGDLKLELLGGAIMAFIFALIALTAMGAYLLVMLARMVVLWVLIILSPLAYILAVIPQTKQYATDWWRRFGKQVVVAPVMVFFLWLAFATLGSGDFVTGDLKMTIDDSDAQKVLALAGTTGSGAQKVSISEVSTWENMANFFVAIAFLFVGLAVVNQMGVVAGGFTSGVMDFGKKVLMIGTGYAAGKWLVGGAGKIGKGVAGSALMNVPFVGGHSWMRTGKRIGEAFKEHRILKHIPFVGGFNKEYQEKLNERLKVTQENQKIARQKNMGRNAGQYWQEKVLKGTGMSKLGFGMEPATERRNLSEQMRDRAEERSATAKTLRKEEAQVRNRTDALYYLEGEVSGKQYVDWVETQDAETIVADENDTPKVAEKKNRQKALINERKERLETIRSDPQFEEHFIDWIANVSEEDDDDTKKQKRDATKVEMDRRVKQFGGDQIHRMRTAFVAQRLRGEEEDMVEQGTLRKDETSSSGFESDGVAQKKLRDTFERGVNRQKPGSMFALGDSAMMNVVTNVSESIVREQKLHTVGEELKKEKDRGVEFLMKTNYGKELEARATDAEATAKIGEELVKAMKNAHLEHVFGEAAEKLRGAIEERKTAGLLREDPIIRAIYNSALGTDKERIGRVAKSDLLSDVSGEYIDLAKRGSKIPSEAAGKYSEEEAGPLKILGEAGRGLALAKNLALLASLRKQGKVADAEQRYTGYSTLLAANADANVDDGESSVANIIQQLDDYDQYIANPQKREQGLLADGKFASQEELDDFKRGIDSYRALKEDAQYLDIVEKRMDEEGTTRWHDKNTPDAAGKLQQYTMTGGDLEFVLRSSEITKMMDEEGIDFKKAMIEYFQKVTTIPEVYGGAIMNIRDYMKRLNKYQSLFSHGAETLKQQGLTVGHTQLSAHIVRDDNMQGMSRPSSAKEQHGGVSGSVSKRDSMKWNPQSSGQFGNDTGFQVDNYRQNVAMSKASSASSVADLSKRIDDRARRSYVLGMHKTRDADGGNVQNGYGVIGTSQKYIESRGWGDEEVGMWDYLARVIAPVLSDGGQSFELAAAQEFSNVDRIAAEKGAVKVQVAGAIGSKIKGNTRSEFTRSVTNFLHDKDREERVNTYLQDKLKQANKDNDEGLAKSIQYQIDRIHAIMKSDILKSLAITANNSEKREQELIRPKEQGGKNDRRRRDQDEEEA